MRAEQASNTALVVAAGVQILARDPGYLSLVPGPMAAHGQRLLRASHPRLSRLINRHWFRMLAYAAEQMTLPGILQHYILRKIVIRDYVAQAISAGARQIILTGAGYDSLCMELAAQYPDLNLIEIDHPATQAVKRAATGMSDANRIHYIAAELGKHSLREVLSKCPYFDANLKTLFIAEGLLMYLTINDVARLLQQMRSVAVDTSLIFTWMEIQSNGKPNFRPASKIIDFFLKKKSEPFLSGMAQEQVSNFLQQHGYCLQDMKESAEVAQQAYKIKPVAGEYICFVENQQV
ncbi:class I SAM-dependent methyltransferase [Undibacterium sp. JH2W]|uniref:class I SAM-dependent methyltransferase n=1 Tax=Undibacterium sp. JH2W TaxID=3413037 RepID=UPI003BF3AE33